MERAPSRRPWPVRRLLLTVLLFALPLGCGSSPDASSPKLETPPGCNPLDASWDCLLPFPSDFFLVDDPSMPSGHRVEIDDPALFRTDKGDPVDLLAQHPADGFSHGTQIMALFPGGVDDSNLVTWTGDLSKSLTADSPTALIEADTGERVLHMAELDPRASDDAERAMLIRPLVRLKDQTRYIVAISRLVDKSGRAVKPPEGFRRIRDGVAEDNKVLAPIADHYEKDIFPVLEKAGVDRNKLQLAWDFTTESNESVTRDMLAVRSDLVTRMKQAPPAITVKSVKNNVNADTYRVIEASMKVPLYVDSPDPGAQLNYDKNGKVTAKGEADVPFTVIIPESVANAAPGDPPARLLQFGHGFFGDRHEAENHFVYKFANQYKFVVVAADWWGMSKPDRGVVIDTIQQHPGNTAAFTDRVHQGMANFIALSYAAKGPLASLPQLAVNGAPAYDPAHLYFYGISLGGILGGTYLALAPNAERGTLGVGGADLSLMMFRAQPFNAFLFVISTVISDPLSQQKLALLSQTTFDRIDPVTWAPDVLEHPLPDSPAERRVLLQVGVGDAAVPNIASHLYARELGLEHLVPAPEPIVGVPDAKAPVDGSAIVEFDFGVDPLPGIKAESSAMSNPVHEGVRIQPAGEEQINRFFKPGGLIENTCQGPCDPE
jgi:hypothetical protein